MKGAHLLLFLVVLNVYPAFSQKDYLKESKDMQGMSNTKMQLAISVDQSRCEAVIS